TSEAGTAAIPRATPLSSARNQAHTHQVTTNPAAPAASVTTHFHARGTCAPWTSLPPVSRIMDLDVGHRGDQVRPWRRRRDSAPMPEVVEDVHHGTGAVLEREGSRRGTLAPWLGPPTSTSRRCSASGAPRGSTWSSRRGRRRPAD